MGDLTQIFLRNPGSQSADQPPRAAGPADKHKKKRFLTCRHQLQQKEWIGEKISVGKGVSRRGDVARLRPRRRRTHVCKLCDPSARTWRKFASESRWYREREERGASSVVSFAGGCRDPVTAALFIFQGNNGGIGCKFLGGCCGRVLDPRTRSSLTVHQTPRLSRSGPGRGRLRKPAPQSTRQRLRARAERRGGGRGVRCRGARRG